MGLSKEKSYDYEIRTEYKHIQERAKTAKKIVNLFLSKNFPLFMSKKNQKL